MLEHRTLFESESGPFDHKRTYGYMVGIIKPPGQGSTACVRYHVLLVRVTLSGTADGSTCACLLAWLLWTSYLDDQ